MMTPALIIALMILGWSAAAAAMLWGMLRIARYHHGSSEGLTPDSREPERVIRCEVSLSA